MSLNKSPDPESEITAARQRLVKRNWRFSVIPAVVLGILLLVLGWELLRQNINSNNWPWRLSLLGVAPAAALSGVFAGLIIAREQFARSMRPSLSWSTQFRRSDNLEDSAWTVHLMNFGPGLAHVESVKFSLSIATQAGIVHLDDVSRYEAVKLFNRIGLQEGRDYFFSLITPGTPLPVVKQKTEGFEFAAFKEDALKSVRSLNFRVRIVDIMGDHHEKSLPVMATLTNSAKHDRPNELPKQPAMASLPNNTLGGTHAKRASRQRTSHGKRG